MVPGVKLLQLRRQLRGLELIVKSDTMDGLKPLESLKLTCNVKSNWHAFKQRFQLHSETLGLDSKPDSKKVALELTIADPQAVKVYNTFVFADNQDHMKLDVVPNLMLTVLQRRTRYAKDISYVLECSSKAKLLPVFSPT